MTTPHPPTGDEARHNLAMLDNAALREAFEHAKIGQTVFTRRMAIDMADMFGVRPMSLVWRLEKIGALKRGSWEWFKTNGGITQDHIAQARQERGEPK